MGLKEINICFLIHAAINDVLIEEMEWNDDDAIRSIDVPMKASLEIGKSWDKLVPLNNNATLKEIKYAQK